VFVLLCFVISVVDMKFSSVVAAATSIVLLFSLFSGVVDNVLVVNVDGAFLFDLGVFLSSSSVFFT